jgi:peptide/nickel transport system permease protein
MTDIQPAQANAAVPRRLTGRALWWLDGWRRFRRNRLSVIGLALALVLAVCGLLAPLIAPHGPFELIGTRLSPPSLAFPFGTDNLGRDVLSGVLYGTRTSLEVGFISTFVSLVVGVLVGSIAGYYGGLIDDLAMRFAEFFQVLPRFFFALIIVALFGANLWATIFIIGMLSWAEIARLVRSEFLTIRGRAFVTAARAYGAGDAQIILREILPNAMSSVVVVASLQIPSAIILEAGLSFIGAGDPNVASWGRMLNGAQQYMRQAWWTAAFPGAAISLMALALALLADGINDFFNPRLRQTV